MKKRETLNPRGRCASLNLLHMRECAWVCMHLCTGSNEAALNEVKCFQALGWNTHQAPLPLEFSRQEYWSMLPCPLPGDLPNPGIKPTSFMSPALADSFFTTNVFWEACCHDKDMHYITC